MNELNLSEWISVINQIKRLDEKYEGIMDVVITGGEPLLRSDLEEILSYITRQKLRHMLLSSGEPIFDDRITKLLESGLEKIRINLTSHKYVFNMQSPIMHIKNEVTKKLNIAKKFKDFGVKEVGGNIVLTSYYLNFLEEIAKLAYKSNLDWIEIHSVIKVGHGYINQKFIVPDPNDERTIQEKLKRLIEIYGENFIQNYVDTDILYSRIPIPTNWGEVGLVIAPNGDIYPGSEATSIPLSKLGNIKNDSLVEIWFSNPLLNKIRSLSFLGDSRLLCEFSLFIETK
ncbi:MAG: radical SAM protein [Thermoproteota archaeon]|uniref:radical SAM protein n=1 Tax=Sulfolobaceae TaxID=118883 RepID=UPI001F11376D|nr:radical SAM protein [Saccharolobus shibatae]MCH4816539.1 radical SAM protein [Saccharolobus shibatae]